MFEQQFLCCDVNTIRLVKLWATSHIPLSEPGTDLLAAGQAASGPQGAPQSSAVHWFVSSGMQPEYGAKAPK